MKIIVSENSEALGVKAAKAAACRINAAIKANGRARIILSTGASQFDTLKALVKEDIDWSKVEMFHLDEYINLGDTHPASFIKYLRERFLAFVTPGKVTFVDTSKPLDVLFAELTAALNEAPVDLGLIGIGENAHIAFNDPPADFNDPASYKVVKLDEACRNQQFGEGWFPTFDDVPKEAVSMTVSQIMKCTHIISAVPYAVKANAVRDTLANELTNMVPATMLKTHPSWELFIDKDSAAKADPAVLEQFKA